MLEIYLGSVLGSFAVQLIAAHAITKRLKRDGYGEIDKKRSLSERICSALKIAFYNLIPIFNIILAGVILSGATNDKMYNIYISRLLKEKAIYKTDELLAKEEEEKLAQINYEEIKSSLDNKDTDLQNKYASMNDAEKLAFLKQERDNILRAGNVEEPVIQKIKDNNKFN